MRAVFYWICLFIGILKCATQKISNDPCPDQLLSLSQGMKCTIEWAKLKKMLKPTQPSIGFSWSKAKMLEDFKDGKSSQKEMDSKPVPVALNSEGAPHCLDHHHTLAALDLGGPSLSSVFVTLYISCIDTDSSGDQFWQKLEENKMAYLYTLPESNPKMLPQKIVPEELPSEISMNLTGSSFEDDPWRSVSSFVRKISDGQKCPKGNKYCNRGYDRVCDLDGYGIPFFEFRWAYFIADATYHNQSLWPQGKNRTDFERTFETLSSKDIPAIDPGQWQAMASLLLPLLRGVPAVEYVVPSTVAPLSGKLPGAHLGFTPIPEPDPDCKLVMCK